MPPPTYALAEITELTGLAPRTVRYYVERGLLAGPTPRGVGTRYSREQLVRLLAIKHLHDTERLQLDAIKRRLAKLSPAEIEALLPPAPAPAPPAAAERAEAPSATAEAAPYAYQRWDYVELIPGLELRVRSDAGPVLRRLAREIHAQYGAAARGDDQDEARSTDEIA